MSIKTWNLQLQLVRILRIPRQKYDAAKKDYINYRMYHPKVTCGITCPVNFIYPYSGLFLILMHTFRNVMLVEKCCNLLLLSHCAWWSLETLTPGIVIYLTSSVRSDHVFSWETLHCESAPRSLKKWINKIFHFRVVGLCKARNCLNCRPPLVNRCKCHTLFLILC